MIKYIIDKTSNESLEKIPTKHRVLEYIKQNEGCEALDIVDAEDLTLGQVKRTLDKLSDDGLIEWVACRSVLSYETSQTVSGWKIKK